MVVEYETRYESEEGEDESEHENQIVAETDEDDCADEVRGDGEASEPAPRPLLTPQSVHRHGGWRRGGSGWFRRGVRCCG